MKSPSQFKWSALVALTAIGVMGIVGACGDDAGPIEPPPPPPPPMAAPTNLSATVVSETQVDLTWTDNASTETGYRVESCTGTSCTTFAQAGTVAANVTTFSAMGLTADTTYSFRVAAFNATDTSTFSNTVSVSTELQPNPTASPILVGAGEITSCSSTAGPMSTAALIQGMLSDTNVTVFTTGDNLDDTTSGGTYEQCFEPSWGQFKSRTFYSIGNNDYEGGRGAAGVHTYFGDRAGPAGKGWYSFDRGNWHIVVLNTATWHFGTTQMMTGSEQLNWLAADLQANTKPCIMAISWERRFYSGTGTWHRQGNLDAIWELLYSYRADVYVASNDQYYERYALSDPLGNIDEANGIRQFIVGTGGRFLRNLANPAPNVEVRDQSTWGVIKFTLNADNYQWEFMPTTQGGFTDSGQTSCH